MRLLKGGADALIAERAFQTLFVEQGFDIARGQTGITLSAGDAEFAAEIVGQKRGFVICVCESDAALRLDKGLEKALLRDLARAHYEHLLILCGKDDNGREHQRWLVSIRPQNRPLRMAAEEWRQGKDNQSLREKLRGLIFPLEEEEGLTIVQVVERVRNSFAANSEQVTRRFYQRFRRELEKFNGFIRGIAKQVDKEQYGALMLNRLMFIYFIQKKGFLNNEPDYLNARLQQTREKYGRDKFHEKFYREFLRRLFKDGLNTPAARRSAEIDALLGKVPYLNGGLFDAHKLETENPRIQIPDEAFANLFKFFDQYRWHLDSRAGASGNEINPDVLGYIFEKYINERARMGAYYTQEDITRYIAKNTILPHLLARVKRDCANAFNVGGIWRLLRENPDGYIYAALRHGCALPDEEMPDNIRAGIKATGADLPKLRRDWNTPAAEAFALPAETWRETIARRGRYRALRAKLAAGEIHEINDLITYNLDIVRFAGDALDCYEGSDFIDAFFRAIAGVRPAWKEGANYNVKRGISVLDPACGSGAFLFAALNILHPLYKACVQRMREFVRIDDARADKKPRRHKLFRNILAEIRDHKNEEYWIYKTLILENLYGADIMPEAAEVAKLRLFLQLAAVAECDINAPNMGLEPLPDIDYNIRAGNSLVGFAGMEQFESHVKKELDLESKLSQSVRQKAQRVKLQNDLFRGAQDGGGDYVRAKKELGEKLGDLNAELDRHLAKTAYGIDADKSPQKLQEWKRTHRPFHWLAEFYGVIEENGGFDVVIGNPPYVSRRSRGTEYGFSGYSDDNPPDLYAAFLERTHMILNSAGNTGMIVALSLGFSRDFAPYRQFLFGNYSRNWFSSYGRIPSGLFTADVRTRNTIHIGVKAGRPSGNLAYTTKLHRWFAKQRKALFEMMEYSPFRPDIWDFHIPKLSDSALAAAFESRLQTNERMNDCLATPKEKDKYPLFYRGTAYNWLNVAAEFPPCYSAGGEVILVHAGWFDFAREDERKIAMLLMSGKFAFLFWLFLGSDFTVTRDDLLQFPISLKKIPQKTKRKLLAVYEELSAFLPETAQYKLNAGQRIGVYNLAKCRHVTDKSDLLFAEMLGMADIWESIELYNIQTIKAI